MTDAKQPKTADLIVEDGGQKLAIFLNTKEEIPEEQTLILDDKKISVISTLYSLNLKIEDIAGYLKVSKNLFQKMVDEIPQLQKAIKEGQAKMKSSLKEALYKKAIGDEKKNMPPETQAILASLYMFGGEQSPHLPKKIEEDKDNAVEDTYDTAEDRLRQIEHLSKLLVKGGVLASKNQVGVDEKALEQAQKTENTKNFILRKIGAKKETSDGE